MSNTVRTMRWQVPAHGSGPYDSDLRTALRDVPVLPAPTNVTDLLARFGEEKVADESDLAEIILDARYPDIPGGFEAEKSRKDGKGFFEPISRAANSNVPQPAPYRPSRFPAVIVTLAILGGAALVAWKVIPRPDGVSPSLVTLPPHGAEIEYVGILSFEGPDGSINIADNATNPAEQTEQGAATSSANQAGAVVVPRAAASDPGAAPYTEEARTLANTSFLDQSDKTENFADAAEEPEGAAMPPHDREALRELVSATEEPTITSIGGGQSPGTATGPYGIWAVSRNACASKMRRKGYLLTYIYPEGARAGGTACIFDTTKRRRRAFDIPASCSDGKRTWKSNVRLSLHGERLTWASHKGSRTYVRCPSA